MDRTYSETEAQFVHTLSVQAAQLLEKDDFTADDTADIQRLDKQRLFLTTSLSTDRGLKEMCAFNARMVRLRRRSMARL
jgi:signal transduction protein with GAF and PtsI domain